MTRMKGEKVESGLQKASRYRRGVLRGSVPDRLNDAREVDDHGLDTEWRRRLAAASAYEEDER